MCNADAVQTGVTVLSLLSSQQNAAAQKQADAAAYGASKETYEAKADLAREEAKMRIKEAEMNDAQAAITEKQADNTLVDGFKAVAAYQLKVEEAIGGQRAAMGGSGFEVNTGSNVELQMDTAAAGAMDSITIQHEYAKKSFELEQTAFAQRSAAYASRFQASQARRTAEMYDQAAKSAGKAKKKTSKKSGAFGWGGLIF